MANFYTDNPDLAFQLNNPLMKKIVALKERNFAEKDKYPDAPINFEDAMDSYSRVLDVIGDISANTIAQNAKDIDVEGPSVVNNEVVYAKGTQENLKALVQAGLSGITLPRKYDGLNFPTVPYVMVADIVSRADAGFVNIWGLQECSETINEFGSTEQKEKYLKRLANGETAAMALTEPDAGSDLQAVNIKATQKEDGSWVLNGVKRFITNGDADVSLVLARSEEDTTDGRGLSMFIYDRQSKALKVRRIENKMGIKGSPTCELVFTNAPAELVGKRKMGLIRYVMALMNGARLGIGAQSVGVSEAAYREALTFANERVQFGKKISELPPVAEMVSVIRARLDASRALLYETSRYVDMYKAYMHISSERDLTMDERKDMKKYKKLANMFTPLLKGTSSEYCNRNAYDALQIHGGSGFMKDYPIERIYRDARITSIYEGTTQMQVVAAIRGVTTGIYLNRCKEYDAMDIKPEYQELRKILQGMMTEFETTIAQVIAPNDADYQSFQARRLVEMAGNIVMGYLLIVDASRDDRYAKSARIFIERGKAENAGKAAFIAVSKVENLKDYKI